MAKESLSSWWGKLQVGTELMLTYARKGKEPVTVARKVEKIKTNSVGMSGPNAIYPDRPFTAEAPVWYDKPTAKQCQVTGLTLVDTRSSDLTLTYVITKY